jgi:hypothetical protein
MNFAIVSPSNQGRVALVHLVQCLPTSTATAPPTVRTFFFAAALNSKTIRLEFVRLETRAGLGRAQNAQPALRPVEHIEHRLGDRLVVHGRQADGQGAQPVFRVARRKRDSPWPESPARQQRLGG